MPHWPTLFNRTKQAIIEVPPSPSPIQLYEGHVWGTAPDDETPFKGINYSVTVDQTGKVRPGAMSRTQVWKQNDKIFEMRSEVSSAFMALAGYVIARGFVTVATDPKDPTAINAKDICDKYTQDIGLDQIIYEGTMDLAKHGNLFLENKIVTGKLLDTRLFPWQDAMEPATLTADGEIATWRQYVPGKQSIEFEPEEIVHIRLPPLDEQRFGTPLLQSVKKVLATNDQLETDVGAYMHGSAFPKEIFSLSSPQPERELSVNSVQLAYARLRQWNPGDKFVTDMNVNYQTAGVGRFESRLIPSFVSDNADKCVSGLIMPTTSYLRSATEASAATMEDHANRALIMPIQRIWKRKIELEMFKPLLVGEGIDEKYVPQIVFGLPTEEEVASKTVRIISMYTAGLQQGQPGLLDRAECRGLLDIADPEKPPEPMPATQPGKTGLNAPTPAEPVTPPEDEGEPAEPETENDDETPEKRPGLTPTLPKTPDSEEPEQEEKPVKGRPHINKLHERSKLWTDQLQQVVKNYMEKKVNEKEARSQAVTVINVHCEQVGKIALERLKTTSLPPETVSQIERLKQQALRDFEKILKDVKT